MINVEIKARCTQPHQVAIRHLLKMQEGLIAHQPDRQIDTYFNVPIGRLKLRESRAENYLIQYDRPDQGGPKVSKYHLHPVTDPTLKVVLTAALGVKIVVDKSREIYYVGNVKFHLDQIRGLGHFLEVEARDEDETIGEAKLHEQCHYWMVQFAVREDDLIGNSYSDMIT